MLKACSVAFLGVLVKLKRSYDKQSNADLLGASYILYKNSGQLNGVKINTICRDWQW